MSTTKPTQPPVGPWTSFRHADLSGWTLAIHTDDRERVPVAVIRVGHNLKRPKRASIKAYTRWRIYAGDYTLQHLRPCPQALSEAAAAIIRQAPHLPLVPHDLLAQLTNELKLAGVVSP